MERYRHHQVFKEIILLSHKKGASRSPPPLWMDSLRVLRLGLAQQLEHALGNLVSLSQHGLGGLDQDVVLDVAHHFLGHIGVADGGLSVLDVLGHHGQVVGGVVQTVLNRAYWSIKSKNCIIVDAML